MGDDTVYLSERARRCGLKVDDCAAKLEMGTTAVASYSGVHLPMRRARPPGPAAAGLATYVLSLPDSAVFDVIASALACSDAAALARVNRSVYQAFTQSEFVKARMLTRATEFTARWRNRKRWVLCVPKTHSVPIFCTHMFRGDLYHVREFFGCAASWYSIGAWNDNNVSVRTWVQYMWTQFTHLEMADLAAVMAEHYRRHGTVAENEQLALALAMYRA